MICHGCKHVAVNDNAKEPYNTMCRHPDVYSHIQNSLANSLECLFGAVPNKEAAKEIGCVLAEWKKRKPGEENIWPISYHLNDVITCEKREEADGTTGPVHE